MDERLVMHRFRSTRWAVMVGAAAMAAYFGVDCLVHHRVHWEILAFLGLMAATKAGAMLYYRLTN